MSSAVIEWAPFTIGPGVSEEQLLEASEALQSEFLARQPGFVRRELLRGENREWCDLVYWEDAAAARAAVEQAASSGVCLRYFQLMEGADHADPGAGVRHLSLRRSYLAA